MATAYNVKFDSAQDNPCHKRTKDIFVVNSIGDSASHAIAKGLFIYIKKDSSLYMTKRSIAKGSVIKKDDIVHVK